MPARIYCPGKGEGLARGKFALMHAIRAFLLTTCLVGLAGAGYAQGKKFTMVEATSGLATTLAPSSIRSPSWQPGTHRLWQVVKSGGADAWVGTEFPGGATDTVTLARLNQDFFSGDTLKNLPALNWLADGRFYFTLGQKVYIHNELRAPDATPVMRTLTEGAENTTVEPTRAYIAYTVANNLWLNREGTNIQVTADRDPNIVNGQAVHRNEFGIDGGIFFSPKGSLLAYYRMDQSDMADYPVVRWTEVPAKADLIKYPMAGDTSHYVTVRVFDPASQKTVELQTCLPRDQYLTAVTWSPDELYLYVGVLNREQNHLRVNQYDARSGALVKTLFEERSEQYVEPQHPFYAIPGRPDEMIWWSTRSGYTSLYHYRMTDGKMLRWLVPEAYEVNEILAFNAGRNELIFSAAGQSPLGKNLYAVNLKNGKRRRLDAEDGVHTAQPSSDGAYLYDVLTSATVPRRSAVRSVDGKFSKTLLDAPDPLAGYDRAAVRAQILPAADGTPLYGRLILPKDFDSTRRYPVVVYLYNGPHVQLVRNTYPQSGNLWYEYLAQRGYIVWTMDGRGSANRGDAFERATFRQLGTVEMEDQMQGVAFLKSLPYVDTARLGVHGWSFGGFMTTSLMTRYPGTFACAVAGGPVMDWRMYEVMYTERYMDTPEENPEGYANSNLLTKAANLQDPLLIIHGTDDDVVVWQHSILFLKAAVSAGKQGDYFVYPGHLHNVRGKDRVHLMQKITDYFDLHLKPEGAGTAR